MQRYKRNARWLMWFAPFRSLSMSAAYLTPFFLQKGLDLSQVLWLQSIFSIAVFAWEVPSGYIADRIGRAASVKLSAPIAAVAMIGYSFSGEYWQFVLWELLLAASLGLRSGADSALLYDSLAADGNEEEYTWRSRRIDSLDFASNGFGVVAALALVPFFGVSSALLADGLLMLVGFYFACKLVEAPHYARPEDEDKTPTTVWQCSLAVLRNPEVRWLTILAATLSASTYMAFWMSTPYFTGMGVPEVLFGVILAVRNVWKAAVSWLAHRYGWDRHLQRSMVFYALTAGLVYLAMASGQLWLVWAVLGHDVIQALHKQPLNDRVNRHFFQTTRATMNSVVNMFQRLVYAVAGLFVGLLIDMAGLWFSLIVVGAVSTVMALLAIIRLHRYKTFHVQ